ncbi:MAG: hypothetical protein OHK0046_42070 [Anaerolineae bacterium]
MATNIKRRIFISYQRQHEEDIRALVQALESESLYEVWYDKKMGAGNWWDQIIDQIQQADIVVLALSPSYFRSEACRRERLYAAATRRALLPVIVDPELDYKDIPEDLRALQIEKYFGKVEQYVKLRSFLNQIDLSPLPNPLPEPPEAPMGTAPAVPPTPIIAPPAQTPAPEASIETKIQTTVKMPQYVYAIISGVLVIALLMLIVTFLVDNANDDPEQENDATTVVGSSTETPTGPSSAPPAIESASEDGTDATEEVSAFAAGTATAAFVNSVRAPVSSPTATTQRSSASAVPDELDITVVYGGNESLAIVVNGPSDLSQVELRTFAPQFMTLLTTDFPALLATEGSVDAGTCLIYELAEANPRRPLACDNAQNFIAPLQNGDVFWFDTTGNRFVDVGIYQNDALVRLCPNTNGSGRCDVAAGQ